MTATLLAAGSPAVWPTPWIDKLGWVLLHSLWQFAAVALIALALRRALASAGASVRYWTCLAALAVVVCLPVATWAWLPDVGDAPNNFAARERTPGDDAAPATPSPMLPPVAAANGTAPSGANMLESSEPSADRASLLAVWRASIESAVRPWLPALVGAWCLGVVLFSLRPLISWRAVRRLRRQGVSPVPNAVGDLLSAVSQRLRLRTAVELLQSTLVHTPVLIGYFRPAILLPVSVVSSLPTHQLEAILAHELAHVRRHDYLINLLQTLVETAFFYHPAVWWLSRQIRVERENCCDDAAVAVVGNPVGYGRALLAIEELRGPSPLLSLSSQGGSLISRIRRLLPNDAGVRSGSWSLGLTAAPLSLLVGAAAAWYCVAGEPESKESSESSKAVTFIHGFSLSGVPSKDYRETPQAFLDLYQPDPKRPGEYVIPDGVFQMPLEGNAWLSYPVGSGHFYLEHRTDREDPKTERTYGPITGDPFDKLRIEEHLAEQLLSKDNASNARLRIARMVQKGDDSMIARAVKLLELGLSNREATYENFPRLEANLHFTQEYLRKYPARFRAEALQPAMKRLQASIAGVEKMIDAHTHEPAAESYNSATYLQAEIPTVADKAWGPDVNGLRLGLATDARPAADNRVTASTTEPIKWYLVVKNVSEGEIKIANYDVADRAVPVIRDRDGAEAKTERSYISTKPIATHWMLKPGEQLLVGRPSTSFVPNLLGAAAVWKSIGHTDVLAAAPEYTLGYRLGIGDFSIWNRDDAGRPLRSHPARGEWTGELATGEFRVMVLAAKSDADKPAKQEAGEGETAPPVKPEDASKKTGAADASISWRIRLVDGEKKSWVARQKVLVEVLPTTEQIGTRVLAKVAGVKVTAESDAEGRVQVTIPKGRPAAVRIVDGPYFSPGYRTMLGVEGRRNFSDPAKEHELKVWRGVAVTGRLVRPDGSPGNRVPVTVGAYLSSQEWKKRLGMDLARNSWDHGDWPNWVTNVMTGDDGRFTAIVPPSEAWKWLRVGSSSLDLSALSDAEGTLEERRKALAFAPFEQEVKRDDSLKGPIDFGTIKLESGVVLKGQVLDAAGKPVAGAMLFTSGKRGPFAGRSTTTDKDGRFEFLPLNPGSTTITVDARLRDASGQVTSRDVQAVFVPTEISLSEGEAADLRLQAVPHLDLDFRWVDRRQSEKYKGTAPSFRLSGKLLHPISDQAADWNGETERVKGKDGEVLRIKVPKHVQKLSLYLARETGAEPTYHDGESFYHPGSIPLGDPTEKRERTIFCDDLPAGRPSKAGGGKAGATESVKTPSAKTPSEALVEWIASGGSGSGDSKADEATIKRAREWLQKSQVDKKDTSPKPDEKQEPAPAAEDILKVYSLKYALAQEMAELLGKLYPKELTIAADARTNTLIVKGSDKRHHEVEAILMRLDAPGEKDGEKPKKPGPSPN